MTTPYTYLIKHIPTNTFYYGCRYAIGCHPSEFWNTYKTSSKYVLNLINEFGEESFEFEIRKTFVDSKSARNWENKVLRRIHAVKRKDFLNRTDNASISHEDAERGRKNRKSSLKHKSAVSHVGKSNKGLKRSLETKRKISNALLGNKYKKGVIESDESREKKRLAHLGKSSGMLGKKQPRCSCILCKHETTPSALAKHFKYHH